MTFDTSGITPADQGIFGLPYSEDAAKICIYPVPWEVTTSYGAGTSKGPEAIRNASYQLDLMHPDYDRLWDVPIALLPQDDAIASQNLALKPVAQQIYRALESGVDLSSDEDLRQKLDQMNAVGRRVNQIIRDTVSGLRREDRCVVVLGGEHSVAQGAIAAYDDVSQLGILQIDAHMDLRRAYGGFEFSHASVMANCLQYDHVSRLVQVGIRDYCAQEAEMAEKSDGRVTVFYDHDLSSRLFSGDTFAGICQEIVSQLPDHVYISFDIDGLEPSLCPHTGTPVPGGLTFQQATYLVSQVIRSGRTVVGCDLVEVAPGPTDWDGNVGARVLWHLIGVLAKSKLP